MTTQLYLTYDLDSDFVFDSDLIELSANHAKLKDLDPGGGVSYSTASPSIYAPARFTVSSFYGLSFTAILPTNTSVSFTLMAGDKEYYWTGLTWAESNGTVAQSSDISGINDNSAAFTAQVLDFPKAVGLRVFLRTTSSTVTPQIADVVLGGHYEDPANTVIGQCEVKCRLLDLGLDPLAVDEYEPILYARNARAFKIGDTVVAPFENWTDFDADGNASIFVPQTESVGQAILFMITFKEKRSRKTLKFRPAIIPAAVEVDLLSLTDLVLEDLG